MAITVTGKIHSTGKSSVSLTPGGGEIGVFATGYTNENVNTIDYIVISSMGNATAFGVYSEVVRAAGASSNGVNDRGIIAGGLETSAIKHNIIRYITISSTGDTELFGEMTITRSAFAAVSNGTSDKCVFCLGFTSGTTTVNILDYVTISSTGNAQLFGNRATGATYVYGSSNGVNDRGIFSIGRSGSWTNEIEYITISSTGSSVVFGEMTQLRAKLGATSNDTNERGLFAGGTSFKDVIDYVTISSLGNATDFGDLTILRAYAAGASSGVGERGVFAGGEVTTTNRIDYVTIDSLGNASDFGDLTNERGHAGGLSNAAQ